MKSKPVIMPKFVNEAQEADWWVSHEGREFVKRMAAVTGTKGRTPKGSRLVGQLNKSPASKLRCDCPNTM